MNFNLTSEHIQKREEFRKFVADHIAPNAAEADALHLFPGENIRKMAERGYMGLPIPVEWGGQGSDFFSYIMLIEEISKACASTGVILSVHTSVGSFPLLLYGTEEQKKKYLFRLAKGDWLGGFALTEAQAGSDPGALKVTARYEDGYYYLNGTKLFITNGGEADIYTVFATTDPQKGHRAITAFLVEKDVPGLIIGKNESKMGLNGSATVELIFENAKVPADCLLGEENGGLSIALSLLDGGRIGIAAQGLGIAAASIFYARDYLNENPDFRENKGSCQGAAFAMADLYTRLEAAKMLVYRAAWMKDQGLKCTKEASMAKVTATDLAMDASSKALSLMGYAAATDRHPVERFFRDAKVTQIYEGTNQIQRIVIARELLKSK